MQKELFVSSLAKKFLFLAFLLFVSASKGYLFAQCAGGTWQELAPMNEPRQEIAVAAVNGFIYVIGGLQGRANANEIYDSATDTWGIGADLPIDTDHAWAVSLNGRVYVGGGSSNRVFAYDPNLDEWTEVASSIYQHGGTPVAAVINGVIYVAGGIGEGMVGNQLEVYDPVTDTWTELSPMRIPRNHIAGGTINGKLYVAGGRPPFTPGLDVLEEYDPGTDTWSDKAPMPTPRSGAAGAVVGGCLYVSGGEGNPNDPNGIFSEVEAYNAQTNTWTQLDPMRTGRHGIYAAVINNMIFIPGGAISQGAGVTDINEVFIVQVE
jgi:N-acetylneuraminic acid mutarotase